MLGIDARAVFSPCGVLVSVLDLVAFWLSFVITCCGFCDGDPVLTWGGSSMDDLGDCSRDEEQPMSIFGCLGELPSDVLAFSVVDQDERLCK